MVSIIDEESDNMEPNEEIITYVCPKCKREISEEKYSKEQIEAGTGGYCYCQFHNERTLINMVKKTRQNFWSTDYYGVCSVCGNEIVTGDIENLFKPCSWCVKKKELNQLIGYKIDSIEYYDGRLYTIFIEKDGKKIEFLRGSISWNDAIMEVNINKVGE